MGNIYLGPFASGNPIGHVDANGIVTTTFEGQIGFVDADGRVYAGTWTNRDQIGVAEPPKILASGAALLLLLR